MDGPGKRRTAMRLRLPSADKTSNTHRANSVPPAPRARNGSCPGYPPARPNPREATPSPRLQLQDDGQLIHQDVRGVPALLVGELLEGAAE
jgi:hypothetical protein